MSQLISQDARSPKKGWVRDGILSFLARGPGNTTEIARALGVSKATVSYHTKALVRRDMIEIGDVKSVRGGVYSKTFVLKGEGLPLVRLRDEQEGSLSKLDEWFERLLVGWHLEHRRKPADEMQVFLYHLFRLLAESHSLRRDIFEEYGQRVGRELIAPQLSFSSIKGGLVELSETLLKEEMALLTAEIRKGEEPRLVCMGCFGNEDHGSLVCSFTQGMLTGVIRAKHGGSFRLERKSPGDAGEPACIFTMRMRGFKA